jgi:hypothetical protein
VVVVSVVRLSNGELACNDDVSSQPMWGRVICAFAVHLLRIRRTNLIRNSLLRLRRGVCSDVGCCLIVFDGRRLAVTGTLFGKEQRSSRYRGSVGAGLYGGLLKMLEVRPSYASVYRSTSKAIL